MHEYLKFWKVDAAVFLRAAPSRGLYITKDLAESLERLKLLSTSEPRALILLTGAAGTGKTTILRWLTDELPINTHELLTLSLVSDEHGPGWLAPRLAVAMGIKDASRGGGLDLGAVARRIDQLSEGGKRLVIAIDSAHLIRTGEALSEVLALLNIQSLSVPCMNFLLAGEPSLMETLGKIPGLQGKIALHVRIRSLSLPETKDYIDSRLRLAGLTCPFDAQALQAIHAWSKGVMASIDIYGEHCLIEAFKKNTRVISLDVARSAARHLLQPHETGNGEDSLQVDSNTFSGKNHEKNQDSSLTIDDQILGGFYLQSEDPSNPPSKEDKSAQAQGTQPPDPKSNSGKNTGQGEGSASIRLSSLFKSVPGRPKPKGP